MIGKQQRIGFYGNPYIGLFMKSNSKITLMPINKPEKFSRVCEVLGTEDITINVFGSPLTGLYSIMNDNGVLFSKVILAEELALARKKIKEAGIDINIGVLETEFTAVANNFVVNNNKCIINPKIKDKNVIKTVKDVLGVEVESLQLEKFNVIGSVVFANDNGFVAHPGLKEHEIDAIEEFLGINGGVGTANSGVPFVSLCLVGNDKSVMFGETTTAFEQQRIIDALGFM
ncbi:MAG: translation initiation factor IF-6 [Candidatus Micrarchaeia archaeon]